jgi:hypothetical protein
MKRKTKPPFWQGVDPLATRVGMAETGSRDRKREKLGSAISGVEAAQIAARYTELGNV